MDILVHRCLIRSSSIEKVELEKKFLSFDKTDQKVIFPFNINPDLLRLL